MKKIISFRKEIPFETNIYEVVSISLEHTWNKTDNKIDGEFIVSGDYKITDTSKDIIPYNYNLPFTIDISTYDIKESTIDIDNFYYEIIDNKVLVVNIDVRIDALNMNEDNEESIFTNLDKDDNYVNYRVYIVRESDTLDSIMNKYNVSKDILECYNDLNDIKLGDKIIIPYAKN